MNDGAGADARAVGGESGARAGSCGSSGDASGADDAEIEALARELSVILARREAVPEALMEAARGAFALRNVDAALAELVFDSLAERAGPMLVRGAGQPRLLTFQSPDLTVEVEIVQSTAGYRIVGQLIGPDLPEAATPVEIRRPGGVAPVEADELGRFMADRVEPGPVSLRCGPTAAGAPAVVTDWVVI